MQVLETVAFISFCLAFIAAKIGILSYFRRAFGNFYSIILTFHYGGVTEML